MKEQLEAIRSEAEAALQVCTVQNNWDAIRVQYLGKKGALTAILKQMGKLSAEERPVMGQMAKQYGQILNQQLHSSRKPLQKLH